MFQKIEPNEPVDLVSQPVDLVERSSQNLSKLSSHSKESQKKKKVYSYNFERVSDTNDAECPNCCSGKQNLMNQLIWFPNQFIQFREILKICQNLPHRFRNPKKLMEYNFDFE